MENPTTNLETENIGTLTRHGFVTFWLWLCIVMSCINAISGVILLAEPDYLLLGIEGIGVGIACVAGLAMLLKWKQVGFYIVAVAQIISCLMTFIEPTDNIVKDAGSPIIALCFLYAVLKIKSKKDGITYWDAMALKAGQKQAEEITNN